jgi:hypothetical protein
MYEGSLAERVGHEAENERLQAKLERCREMYRRDCGSDDHAAEAGVGYEPPFKTPSDKDFMAAHIEALEQRVKGLEDELSKVDCGGPSSQPCKYDPPCLVCHAMQLKAENERLQARLKEQADQYQELIAQLHRDVAERDGEIKRLKNKWEFEFPRLQNELKFLRIDRDEWKNKANLLNVKNVFYYTAEEVDAYKAKVRALVEATKGWHNSDDCRVEGRTDCPLCAALAALEAEDD